MAQWAIKIIADYNEHHRDGTLAYMVKCETIIYKHNTPKDYKNYVCMVICMGLVMKG